MADADFKEAVKAWISIHDQLTEAGKSLRELRKKKAELGEVIIGYMKANDVLECQLSDGKLLRKPSKRLEPLKKEHILGELTRAVGEARAEDVLLQIFSKRGVAEKDVLSRTRKRSQA